MIKILNLYAGIGGNRKLWNGDIEVTAVENEPRIAEIYKKFFPNDRILIEDAHQFLLEHFQEYDFIWSSPPCPTHSRMMNLKNNAPETIKRYPDMRLYQEIIFLSHFCKSKWVVENVIGYYEPLIQPQLSNNHYIWCNFKIENIEKDKRFIRRGFVKEKEERLGFDLEPLNLNCNFKSDILNNCVLPELGLHIFEMAFKKPQLTLEFNKNISKLEDDDLKKGLLFNTQENKHYNPKDKPIIKNDNIVEGERILKKATKMAIKGRIK